MDLFTVSVYPFYSTTYAISTYHHWCCEFEPRSWRGVFDATLCDTVCQWPATGRWFSPGTPVSSTNKTDRHLITEILLKVALRTIKPTDQLKQSHKTNLILFSCKVRDLISMRLKLYRNEGGMWQHFECYLKSMDIRVVMKQSFVAVTMCLLFSTIY
jgi:hypothetical protein